MEPISTPVIEFLKDFSTSLKLARVYEIQSFYEKGWREMSKRFFADRAWPQARDISDAVKGDRVFLTLYRMLYFRHLLSKVSSGDRFVALRHYVEAWEAYIEVFELLLDSGRSAELDLPASWVFELIGQDFLYHFQQFHDLRSSPAGAVRRGAEGEDAPDADEDRLGSLRFGAAEGAVPASAADEAELATAWQLRHVLTYLHRLVDASDMATTTTAVAAAAAAASAAISSGGPAASAAFPTGLRNMAGYFALLALGKLYVKLGDYATAVEMIRPLGVLVGDGLYVRLAKAHMSISYYAGFALIMCRRYDDALRIFSRTLLIFHRTARILDDENTRDSRGGGSSFSSLLKKQAEKMLALLGVCSVVLPGAPVDEPVRRALRDRYAEAMDRMAGGVGDGDVVDIFNRACPGFIGVDSAAEGSVASLAAFESHLRLFKAEVAQRTAGQSILRSFLRLYTNLDLGKLAEYCRVAPEDARAQLTALKIKAFQTGPSLAPESVAAAAAAAAGEASGTTTGTLSDPLHFYLINDTVVIDESRAAFNVAGYFVRQIDQLARIAKDTSGAGNWAPGGRYRGNRDYRGDRQQGGQQGQQQHR